MKTDKDGRVVVPLRDINDVVAFANGRTPEQQRRRDRELVEQFRQEEARHGD